MRTTILNTPTDKAAEVERIAEEYKNAANFLYLGRGYNFPAALEGRI